MIESMYKNIEKTPTNRNGFTLVELSIVIVIVGLLIGGILVGQSMIESAESNRVLKLFQQTEIATQQFKNKYKYLPGDYPRASFGFAGGNGDGRIWVSEGLRAMHMLQASGTIDLGLNPTGTTSGTADTWVKNGVLPDFGIDRSLVSFSWGADSVLQRYDQGYTTGACKHYITLGSPYNSTGSVTSNSEGTRWWFNMPKDLAPYLDRKMDDGVRATGKIMGTGTGIGAISCTAWVTGTPGPNGSKWALSAGYYDKNSWTTAGNGCNIFWCLDDY